MQVTKTQFFFRGKIQTSASLLHNTYAILTRLNRSSRNFQHPMKTHFIQMSIKIKTNSSTNKQTLLTIKLLFAEALGNKGSLHFTNILGQGSESSSTNNKIR
jgi:hypothetical protein